MLHSTLFDIPRVFSASLCPPNSLLSCSLHYFFSLHSDKPFWVNEQGSRVDAAYHTVCKGAGTAKILLKRFFRVACHTLLWAAVWLISTCQTVPVYICILFCQKFLQFEVLTKSFFCTPLEMHLQHFPDANQILLTLSRLESISQSVSQSRQTGSHFVCQVAAANVATFIKVIELSGRGRGMEVVFP